MKNLINQTGKHGPKEYIDKFNKGDKKTEKRESYWKCHLKKILKGRIGQKWDAIYSEICKSHSDPHSRRLIDDMIERVVDFDVKIIGDKFFDSKGLELSARYYEYFVVAEDGILYYLNNRRKYRPNRIRSKIRRLDSVAYFKFNKIWYRIKYVQIEDAIKHQKTEIGRFSTHKVYWVGKDVFGVGQIGPVYEYYLNSEAMKTYGEPIFVTHKEQAGKREIRRLLKEHR